MLSLQGIAVSPGVAIGEAFVVDHEGFRIPRRFVSQDAVEYETQRLQRALDAAAAEIEENRKRIDQQLGTQYGAIFSAHLRMLQDPQLVEKLRSLVRQQGYSPEYAVSTTLREYAQAFEQLPGHVLSERAHDIYDIERRILRQLLGRRREELTHLHAPVVVLAHDLTPGETAQLDPDHTLAFVTEVGGVGGHTAILAKAKEIPAVVGTGRFLDQVAGGDIVIVDGDHGQVVIDPDPETLARYERERKQHQDLFQQFEQLREFPAETADGVRVELAANIEFPQEVRAARRRAANGIGLYRTEFLYLAAEQEPTEEDHYRAYAEVVQAMDGLPVVIRTLDLGADKLGLAPGENEEETNPFLGLRSIRLSLKHVDSFRVQLRAILRASALGPVQVMFPMIATLGELRRAKMVLADAMEDLDEQSRNYDRQIAVGMMVEVPSSAILIERFLQEVDFVSIGTNDLAQYTLAVDRANREVAELYQATDPAVLAMIDRVVRAADAAGKPVSVCGQMSSEPGEALLLLGLGVRKLSMPPVAIPEIKAVTRRVRVEDCRKLAERALQMDTAREVNALLHEALRRTIPDLFSHDSES